jgi:hypothetical protein
LPGGTISSPVVRIETRGFVYARTRAEPIAAIANVRSAVDDVLAWADRGEDLDFIPILLRVFEPDDRIRAARKRRARRDLRAAPGHHALPRKGVGVEHLEPT